MKHTLNINGEIFEGYSWTNCVASIRAAWSWGYFDFGAIDDKPIDQDFLLEIGCY